MLDARAKLALHIKTHQDNPSQLHNISETVLNFFEDLGIAYENKCISKKLADESFSYYVTRYWELVKPYIEHQRGVHGGDLTLFQEFQKLAIEMDEEKDADWKERFLGDEILVADQAIYNLQQRSILLQQFETSFFRQLQMLSEIVSGLNCKETYVGVSPHGPKTESYTGRDCFGVWYARLNAHFDDTILRRIANLDPFSNVPGLPNNNESEIIAIEYFQEFYKPRQAYFGHYFRVLYHIIKFVDSSTLLKTHDEKRKYTTLVRAQLSAYELLIIFYNGICPVAREFRPLIETYELLKHIDKSLLLDGSHKRFYKHTSK